MDFIDKSRSSLIICLFIVTHSFCALAKDKNDSTDISQEATNRFRRFLAIEFENGNTLEFYEPSPGDLFISESGIAPNPPAYKQHDLSDMTPIEIYEYFRPNDETPDILIDAQERMELANIFYAEINDKKAEEEVLEIEEEYREQEKLKFSLGSTDVPKAVSGKCSGDWAARNLAACQGNSNDGYDWRVRWYDGAGDSWFLRHNDETVKTAACAHTGNLTYTFKYRPGLSWKTYGSWTVYQGNYRWVRRKSHNMFDIKSIVDASLNNIYSHCGKGSDTYIVEV